MKAEVILRHTERNGEVVPKLDLNVAEQPVGAAREQIGAPVGYRRLFDILPRDDLSEQ